MAANKLRKAVPAAQITVVDTDDAHRYQPGYLFIPFGSHSRESSTLEALMLRFPLEGVSGVSTERAELLARLPGTFKPHKKENNYDYPKLRR